MCVLFVCAESGVCSAPPARLPACRAEQLWSCLARPAIAAPGLPHITLLLGLDEMANCDARPPPASAADVVGELHAAVAAFEAKQALGGAASAAVPALPALPAELAVGWDSRGLYTALAAGKVVNSLPPHALEDKRALALRVGELQSAELGSAKAWCKKLENEEALETRTACLGRSGAAFYTDGLSQSVEEWFPVAREMSGNVNADEFEALSVSGFALLCTHRNGREPFHRVQLELAAAALGAAPAVFAATVIDSSVMLAHQTISFTLDDVLDKLSARASDSADSLQLQSALFQMTYATARKLRLLADAGLTKLNSTPTAVGFVLKLRLDADNSEFVAEGYTIDPFEAETEAPAGLPMLIDQRPGFVLSVGSAASDAAYFVSAATLLATARARFGEAALPMLHALSGRSPEGRALSADELPEDFSKLSLDTALGNTNAREALCTAMEAASKAAGVLNSHHAYTLCSTSNELRRLPQKLSECTGSLFEPLLCELLESSSVRCEALRV